MGASVNARDLKGLTPLYKTIVEGNSRYSCELLLKEHSEVDVTDFCEWTELHQVDIPSCPPLKMFTFSF